MPVSLQVTMTGSPVQISAHGINFKQLIIQNNSADATVRVGGSNIVAGAYGTGLGLLIAPSGGNFNQGPMVIQSGILSGFYAAGANGTVLDVLYEPA